MAVNIDAGTFATLTAGKVRAGACVSQEVANELASTLRVELQKSDTDANTLCVSTDPNNLLSVDGNGCGLVPSVSQWSNTLTWDSAAPSVAIEFEGFEGSGIDGTQAYYNVTLTLDSTENGVTVKKDPTGTVQLRPSWEITERTTTKITIQIYNAEKDVDIELRLFQFPVPNPTA